MSGARVGWVDASGGISGDMLLGACLDAGVDVAVVQSALDALRLPERITIVVDRVVRSGLEATAARVEVAESHHRRRLGDVLAMLGALPEPVARRVGEVFRALAAAEARVHGLPTEEVHFHEVGALDSIADVVGVVTALDALGLDRLVCSPVALGSGTARTEHGMIPIPGPAVLELLRGRGAPGAGGPIAMELATPTGVALMVALADDFGALPSLVPDAVGTGAGTADPPGHANVVRLVIGSAANHPMNSVGDRTVEVVIEANVDDLDPRVWPQVLDALLAAGASDAWLTPILMKKGRPAHTLSVLGRAEHQAALERIVLTHTSSIGLRVHPVDKVALPREIVTVTVLGESVRVKLARLDGDTVSAVPEYDDVARVAVAAGLPVKQVLDLARSAAIDYVHPA